MVAQNFWSKLILNLVDFSRMKGFKITDVNRRRIVGVACGSLSQLKQKACDKLGISGDVVVALEDGTQVDEEDYFQLLPAQSVFVVHRKTERILTGALSCPHSTNQIKNVLHCLYLALSKMSKMRYKYV